MWFWSRNIPLKAQVLAIEQSVRCENTFPFLLLSFGFLISKMGKCIFCRIVVRNKVALNSVLSGKVLNKLGSDTPVPWATREVPVDESIWRIIKLNGQLCARCWGWEVAGANRSLAMWSWTLPLPSLLCFSDCHELSDSPPQSHSAKVLILISDLQPLESANLYSAHRWEVAHETVRCCRRRLEAQWCCWPVCCPELKAGSELLDAS